VQKKASKQANEQKLKKKILKRNKQKNSKKRSNFILSTPVIVKSKLCIIFFFLKEPSPSNPPQLAVVDDKYLYR